jgi:uncharacterized membrane protein
MKNFNNWLGSKLADSLSTMAFFWFCVLLDILGLVVLVQQTSQAITSHSSLLTVIYLWVAFIAQGVIQLLALPLLAFQNKQMQDNHDDTIKHLKKLHNHLGVKDDK